MGSLSSQRQSSGDVRISKCRACGAKGWLPCPDLFGAAIVPCVPCEGTGLLRFPRQCGGPRWRPTPPVVLRPGCDTGLDGGKLKNL